MLHVHHMGLPWWLSGKESAFQCRRRKRRSFHPWSGKIPWRRKWPPTPELLPGESHGQRSLAGYSPWGSKELAMTEQLSMMSLVSQKGWKKNFFNLSPSKKQANKTQQHCFLEKWQYYTENQEQPKNAQHCYCCAGMSQPAQIDCHHPQMLFIYTETSP